MKLVIRKVTKQAEGTKTFTNPGNGRNPFLEMPHDYLKYPIT